MFLNCRACSRASDLPSHSLVRLDCKNLDLQIYTAGPTSFYILVHHPPNIKSEFNDMNSWFISDLKYSFQAASQSHVSQGTFPTFHILFIVLF